MTAVDQFAWLSGIDEDLVADAIPDAWMGGATSKRHRFAAFYDRFMSSGWVAAVLSVVVALGVIVGIVALGQGVFDDQPSAGGVGATPPAHETAPESPDGYLWLARDGVSEFAWHSSFSLSDEAADLLDAKMMALTGNPLPVLPHGAESEATHAVFLSVMPLSGKQSYYITVADGWIWIGATGDAGFVRAMERLIADATVEGGLRLPYDYEVKDAGEPLWIVKDGEPMLTVTAVHGKGMTYDALCMLQEKVVSMTGRELTLYSDNMLRHDEISFIYVDIYAEGEFCISLSDTGIYIMAADESGFERAVTRLLADVTEDEHGLSLPADYDYEERDRTPSYETGDAFDGPALWIIKGGESSFAIVKPPSFPYSVATGWTLDKLCQLIEEIYGPELSVLDSRTDPDTGSFIRFCLASESDVGDMGFRITVEGDDVILYANSADGFAEAVNRFLADAVVVEGLRLPLDYNYVEVAYESVVPEPPETDPPEEIPEEIIRAFSDKAFAEAYPAAAALGMETFQVDIDRYNSKQIQYAVRYRYRLCGLSTWESYTLTLLWQDEGFTVTRQSASSAGEYSRFHNDCTPAKIETAIAELAELSGEEGGGYLEIRDGQLVLATEIIVSLTPPPDANPSSGCGIDHDHVFYTVVICP